MRDFNKIDAMLSFVFMRVNLLEEAVLLRSVSKLLSSPMKILEVRRAGEPLKTIRIL